MVWVLQDQHFMSTLLHPSLKHFHIAPNKQKKAFDLVKQELLERVWISDGATDTASKAITTAISNKRHTTPTVNSNDLLTRCFDKPQPKPISTPTPVTELDNYMALDEIIDETEDVLLFWKRHAQSFPTLSIIVRDLFSIPASNTIVERLFSASKNIVTDRRSSIGEAKLNKLLFLKKNLAALKELNDVKINKNNEQMKRKVSTADDESIVTINDNDSNSVSSSPITKKTKPNEDNDDDESLNENDDTNDSIEPYNIFLDL
ncbi:unnamed protein product [Rotaria magnacalcarata]|uniref:HAT C-terminal dimerisation domain-containing protein n=1 Tax=Rotaria magnacalcarata TaxID=392030 RepID=A0A815ZYY1_9BILA|nr:unnamed protein product [Rotaria magnacalcarata]CAF4411820.1 unnamed protein product [Rotaria magnacalcarata]